MIQKNKGKLILSSIVILLPMLFCLLSGVLPEKIAVHFRLDGTADGFARPAIVFLVIPPILLAFHWLCLILTAVLDKGNEQNKKITGIMFWILPIISLMSTGTVLAIALGYTANILTFVLVFLAVLFVVIGNYMPKTTRNITAGIKIKWTLMSDENWNATHRFAGKLYVLAGLLCIPAIFLPEKFFAFVAFGLILLCVVPPIVYSYCFYKKQLAAGEVTKESMNETLGRFTKHSKAARVVTVVLVTVILILSALLMYTGDITMVPSEDSLTVKASFMQDLTLAYDAIDAAEYREGGVDGRRIYGFGSARLLMGSFKNEEFGLYTRYTYAGKLPAIVLTVGEERVVLGAETAEETRALYERILLEISE